MDDPRAFTDLTRRVIESLNEALGRQRGTIAEVIRRSGMPKQRTYDIFNGDRAPTVDELAVICRALNVDLTVTISKR